MTDRYDGLCQGEKEEEKERWDGTQKDARLRESTRSMARSKEAEEEAVLLLHENR